MSFFGREKVIIVDNFNYRGPHVLSSTYTAGDAVGSGDALYVAIQDVPVNTAITDRDYWVNGLRGERGPVGYPPLIQFTDDGTTFYNPPATSLTIGYRYSLDNGASWSGFIRTKGNVGPRGLQGEGLEPSDARLRSVINAYLIANGIITQELVQELINNTLRAVTDASIFAEALFSVDRDVWHAQLSAYRYVWLRKIEEDRNTGNPEVVIDLGIVSLESTLTFTHGLKKTGSTVEINDAAFDDTVSTAFYTIAASLIPTSTLEFALANSDGSIFYDLGSSRFDWQTLVAPGRIYIVDTQGDHIGPFGTAGTKTTADYAADDKLIIQAADPLTSPKITLTLSSGPTVYGEGDTAGKYYTYSAIAVDVDFAVDPSSSYRVSLDAHPVIQILAGNIKGNKWVELSAGNLEEFEGDPTHILTVNATGVKEQPSDDLQKKIVNVDTRVRFPSVERQVDNTNTPAANYFSLHTAVDDVTPVRWTAKNDRQKVFLQKFLKAQQVLQFDANASGRIRLLADATVSGNTFSFDAVVTGTVPPVGQIYDMYSLGRALGEIYVARDELEPKETDFWGDFISTSLDPTETDKRWTIGFTSESSGVPTLANQYNTLTAVEAGTRTLVISPTQFNTSDLNDPNDPPGSLTIGTTELSDPLFFNYSLDTSGKNYVGFTPTGTPATLGDEGNGQLLYVAGTVEKHGTIARKSDGGILDDTVAVRDREPSSFFDKLLIPWKAIANFNIANYIASLRQLLVSTSATLTQTTKVLLSDFKTATLAHLGEHIYPQTTKPRDISSTFKTNVVDVSSKNGNIAFQNAFLNGVCQMKWALPDTVALLEGGSIPVADVKKYFTGHHYFEMTNADRSKILHGRVNNFITLSGTYFVNLGLYDGEGTLIEPATLIGTFANDESVTIHLSSNLISRDEIRTGAYKENPMDLLGDADQQAFSSTAWTSYSGDTFEDTDLILLCLSPTATGYGQSWCIRFGDVNNTGGQIYNSGGNTFEGRRNGENYQVRRTAGTGDLYVRIFVVGSNST